ncbi:Phospholipid:diacylglycerol acyltransferase 1 [Hibiscus syriacus]|uniref:Phospholipid:diacylglycerol acyltransferase 1 n=1 Tax=Hibiscus syriacus TaxID=106335 RepID=A0A6A3CU44_HIBSY|nr:Phospholipid:diacylglycerol acyltransferase 1 [Hibiscus syriacus]
MPASFPQYVTEAITGPLPDPPGVKLKKEGLKAKHPVVFVPGIVTGGLELWEGRECAEGLFRKRLWGDPCGIRVRPVSGLVAADYFAPGYFVWAVLIANLARIGYEEKNINIELLVAMNGVRKVVAIPHSMGVLYFLHFMKWVEAPAPVGGGGGSDWCSKHLKAVVNIGGPFLGVPKAIAGLFSAEAKDIAIASCRTNYVKTIYAYNRTVFKVMFSFILWALAPGFLDNDIFQFQTLQHVMRMSRTWDSTMSMIPRGGDTIWGGLDWSQEEGYSCSKKREQKNDTQITDQAGAENAVCKARSANYGRIISFGKFVAEAPSSDIERIDFRGAIKGHNAANTTCRDVWSEYHDMGFSGIKAVAEYKTYTAESVVDLLHFIAPKMMARGTAHFSYGIADNLDDPKYKHYKYWSNPLETTLPNAPDMEIFSLYGVGLPTERAYVYKLSPHVECGIPFKIDTSADDDATCLRDGDETVPVLSAGFMCAKGWRGKTRFNPSGIRTYDVIRIAAGASGEELGGDQVHSNIFNWSEKIKLKLDNETPVDSSR